LEDFIVMSVPSITQMQPVRESPAANLRVLVVDDDPLVLESLQGWLVDLPGVDMRGFASAEEAMNASHGSRYDVCLLDYSLGGVNGVMLGAMVRALNPGVRLILMSGFLNPRIERQAFDHGFHSVIPKPFPLQQLTDLIFKDAGGKDTNV
jgi:DNA-binding NtrC family response regulator